MGSEEEAENVYQGTPIFFLVDSRVGFKAITPDNMCISNTFMNSPNRFLPTNTDLTIGSKSGILLSQWLVRFQLYPQVQVLEKSKRTKLESSSKPHYQIEKSMKRSTCAKSIMELLFLRYVPPHPHKLMIDSWCT